MDISRKFEVHYNTRFHTSQQTHLDWKYVRLLTSKQHPISRLHCPIMGLLSWEIWENIIKRYWNAFYLRVILTAGDIYDKSPKIQRELSENEEVGRIRNNCVPTFVQNIENAAGEIMFGGLGYLGANFYTVYLSLYQPTSRWIFLPPVSLQKYKQYPVAAMYSRLHGQHNVSDTVI